MLFYEVIELMKWLPDKKHARQLCHKGRGGTVSDSTIQSTFCFAEDCRFLSYNAKNVHCVASLGGLTSIHYSFCYSSDNGAESLQSTEFSVSIS